ncbi:MAG: ABC transporter substrate-binding protein [Pseudonocardiaceae bacterium]
MTGSSQISSRVAVAAVVVVLLMAAACGGSGSGRESNAITVWTLENLPERLAAQQAIAAEFGRVTGVAVEVVGIDENQFNQLVMSAAASGRLPDVVGALSLAGVRSLAANELLDMRVPGAVVANLGTSTFSERALTLTRDGTTQLAVPSDAFAQLLLYRRDLFATAGLPEPRNYADITAAARALHTGEVAGFVGSTTPGDSFTQQSFEQLALANGCELVDASGEVSLDSSSCVAGFAFYDNLIRNYSVVGTQDSDTTRATYFAGKAAMMIWSSFILDELAGLRADAAPSCPQCVADPRFLVDNTGIVTAISGPDAVAPAEFGEVVSWAVLADASTEPARRFVEYMMSDGYLDWLAFAPEGKFPTRAGTQANPREYAEAWRTLPAGVDTKAPLTSFYPPEELDALAASVDRLSRWGITQGEAGLIGAMAGELPVPQAISAMTSGEVEPSEAAEQAAEAVSEIQDSLR